ncbi:MAG: paraquat-inducible protein A [Gammaproteobacteria bacterium]|nr:paraquat-inducible protein A [Gammaproteobacteria bacterium]
MTRTLAQIAVIGIAIALLYPGVTRPVLTLEGTMRKADMVDIGLDLAAGEEASRKRQFMAGLAMMFGLDRVEGELEVYRKTRSIVGAVEELVRTGNSLVAVLIVTFSIVVPTFKLLLQLAVLMARAPPVRRALGRVIAAVGKWSMTDVFVMALLVAYLAGSATGQMGDLLAMDARLEEGFWYFLGYCLFSVASTAPSWSAAASRDEAAHAA